MSWMSFFLIASRVVDSVGATCDKARNGWMHGKHRWISCGVSGGNKYKMDQHGTNHD